jgi:hypothetical protein
MATITIQPAQTIDIDANNLVLTKVVDNQADTITASVQGLWRDIILWHGVEEYTQAGIWTNDTARARAIELINSGSIIFI